MKKLLTIIVLLTVTGCSKQIQERKLKILDIQIDYELQAIEDNEGYINVVATYGSDTITREYLSLTDLKQLIKGDTTTIYR